MVEIKETFLQTSPLFQLLFYVTAGVTIAFSLTLLWHWLRSLDVVEIIGITVVVVIATVVFWMGG